MSRTLWTAPEIAHLVRLYPDTKTIDLAAAMGRKLSSVHTKAAALGLKKSAAFNASKASGRIQPGPPGPGSKATQFKPGQKPWNTGRKGWQAGGRSALTRFTTGMLPPNTVPVGSYRIITEKNGGQHLEQKVREVPGPSHKRWTPVSRLVWEAAHGPVPPGCIVVFKPGRRTLVLQDITLDRLECITRAENARRNHPISSNPELAKLCQLKGAITRQVNRITREHEQHQGHPA